MSRNQAVLQSREDRTEGATPLDAPVVPIRLLPRNLPHGTTSEEFRTSPSSLAVTLSSSKQVGWTRIR
jgi:hypothetical protein